MLAGMMVVYCVTKMKGNIKKNRGGWRELQNCETKIYSEKICFLNLQYVQMVVNGKALILIVP